MVLSSFLKRALSSPQKDPNRCHFDIPSVRNRESRTRGDVQLLIAVTGLYNHVLLFKGRKETGYLTSLF